MGFFPLFYKSTQDIFFRASKWNETLTHSRREIKWPQCVWGSFPVKHHHGHRLVKRWTSWEADLSDALDCLSNFKPSCQTATSAALSAACTSTTSLAAMRSNHIFFSLCCRLRLVESKAAGPPWQQPSKFNIRLWGGKRIVLSACTQSLHWLVQKFGFLPHPENDQGQAECVCDF